jgi:hypothetical protein
MPRPAKGPRLYLKRYASGRRFWIIRDAGREIGTGCGEGDAGGAEKALGRYLATKHTPTRSSRLADIPVADVVNVYLSEHAPHVKNREFLISRQALSSTGGVTRRWPTYAASHAVSIPPGARGRRSPTRPQGTI